jgi:hypothetical protein
VSTMIRCATSRFAYHNLPGGSIDGTCRRDITVARFSRSLSLEPPDSGKSTLSRLTLRTGTPPRGRSIERFRSRCAGKDISSINPWT